MKSSLQPLCLAALAVALSTESVQGQGSLSPWGLDQYGEISSVPPGREFTQIAGGDHHYLALRTNGSIAAWGILPPNFNDFGQVSDAPLGPGFIKVAAGQFHSLALRSDGSIATWGRDTFVNQVGTAPLGTGFLDVDGGWAHSVAVRSDGSIVAWGSDDFGMVTQVPTELGFVKVSAGLAASAALRTDGSLLCWGADVHGLISSVPQGTGFLQVSMGTNHCLALRADGSIAAWGSDAQGQVSGAPSGPGYVQVCASYRHSVALHGDGSVVSWAHTTGGADLTNTPTDTGFSAIAASRFSAAAVGEHQSGRSFCFGDGSGSLCPCAGTGSGGRGCANSDNPRGAVLVGLGNPSLSADTFWMQVGGASEHPLGQTGLILRGMGPLNSGSGNPAGDGLLCVSGQSARSQIQISQAWGSDAFLEFKGAGFGAGSYGPGVPTYYQYWYRDPNSNCTGSRFNFSNAWEVTWTP